LGFGIRDSERGGDLVAVPFSVRASFTDHKLQTQRHSKTTHNRRCDAANAWDVIRYRGAAIRVT